MKYFVQGADGEWYGPVDVHALKTWHGQGRLLQSSLIRCEGEETPFPAFQLAEIFQVEVAPGSTCSYCNSPLPSGSGKCYQCGNSLAISKPLQGSKSSFWGGFATGFILFYAMVIGWIVIVVLGFALRKDNPMFAKGLGRGAAVGFLFGILIVLGMLATCFAGLGNMGH